MRTSHETTTVTARPDSRPEHLQDNSAAPSPWQFLWVDSQTQADRRKLAMTPAELERTVFLWLKENRP